MIEVKQFLWKITLLSFLLCSLGAAGTSFGLIKANTEGGTKCRLFITDSQARNKSLINYNVSTCQLSLASIIIATMCLALLAFIEIVKAVSRSTKPLALPVRIGQILYLIVAIVSLFITTFVVSAGWAKTCETYSNLKEESDSTSSFSCTGYQDDGQGLPHGGELITSAVFSGIGILLVLISMLTFVLQQYREIVHTNYQYHEIDEESL